MCWDERDTFLKLQTILHQGLCTSFISFIALDVKHSHYTGTQNFVFETTVTVRRMAVLCYTFRKSSLCLSDKSEAETYVLDDRTHG